jgi:hypothetical protein
MTGASWISFALAAVCPLQIHLNLRLLTSQLFKWHEDTKKRLWVPASAAEGNQASSKASGKTLEDLRKIVPVTGTIMKPALEMESSKAGFTQKEYRGLLAQALDDTTADDLRLYQWKDAELLAVGWECGLDGELYISFP